MSQSLTFGKIVITWELPAGIACPIGVAHWRLNGRCVFVTQGPIAFRRGAHEVRVEAGYAFDGASIPRWFWWLPGFAPLGKHLWAALCHDWLCDHPEELPRIVADAVFAALLLETGVERERATAMAAGVFAYGVYRQAEAWWGTENGETPS